jgi:nicotinate-nucleotide--dimethylbenzimidazole phosphoribosyltransferase
MKKHWATEPCPSPNEAAAQRARQRQLQLTKPAGSLGRLEDLAVALAAMQNSDRPRIERVHIAVFAADHGVAAKGVSAFPQAVTGEMVRNIAAGGAAISVLAKQLGAEMEVVNLGTVNDPGPLDGVHSIRLAASTEDFTRQPAMTDEQRDAALQAGADAVSRALDSSTDLFIGGDMGIGNTTAATALGCALLQREPEALVGPGTGLGVGGLKHKVEMIAEGLSLHRQALTEPMQLLSCLGGFEIAALTGSYIAAAQAGLPVLVDGFIATAAALVAVAINPGCRPWLLFAHASAEPGHRLMVEALEAVPLLSLGMRLGEGSGAAVTVPLLRLACELHNGMATFEQASVSEKR